MEEPHLEAKEDIRANARAIHDYLDDTIRYHELYKDPVMHARLEDAAGLLLSIANGTVTTGQPRIVDRLVEIVQNYPSGKSPSYVILAIGSCSEFGLSASSFEFSESHSLNHTERLKK